MSVCVCEWESMSMFVHCTSLSVLHECMCVFECFSSTWTQITAPFLQMKMIRVFSSYSGSVWSVGHTRHALQWAVLNPRLCWTQSGWMEWWSTGGSSVQQRDGGIIDTVQRSQLGPVVERDPLWASGGGQRLQRVRTLLHEHRWDRQKKEDTWCKSPWNPRILGVNVRLVPLLDVVVWGQSLSRRRHHGAPRHFAPCDREQFGKDLKPETRVSIAHKHTTDTTRSKVTLTLRGVLCVSVSEKRARRYRHRARATLNIWDSGTIFSIY